MNENRRKIRPQDLKVPANKATILSVNADTAPNSFHVSLQWQGNYDISDFDLQRFGKVLRIQDETPNSGWAIIERPYRVPIAHRIPGWATVESIDPLKPGDAIPLRPDLESALGRSRTSPEAEKSDPAE
ncbi:MAG: hypothetical protein JOZ08_10090 [Verrucomicrobia bacterium]|nr:hypothetical protein [Verrucomicrobiota bacterium]MBV8276807.1 hypothetical protein [Verrucomicrobiota bacterium]